MHWYNHFTWRTFINFLWMLIFLSPASFYIVQVALSISYHHHLYGGLCHVIGFFFSYMVVSFLPNYHQPSVKVEYVSLGRTALAFTNTLSFSIPSSSSP